MNQKELEEYAWEKTTNVVAGYDSDMYRKDACGAWIKRDLFGRKDNDYAWGIDYIYPISLGGDGRPENIRALQWKNIISKGNDYPSYEALIIAIGNDNVEERRSMIVNDKKRNVLSHIYDSEK